MPITEAQLDAIIQRAGWAMESRPSRKNTTEFIHTYKPTTGAYAYSLHSKSSDYVERRHRERLAARSF